MNLLSSFFLLALIVGCGASQTGAKQPTTEESQSKLSSSEQSTGEKQGNKRPQDNADGASLSNESVQWRELSVSRSELQGYFDEPDRISRQLRIVPAKEEGSFVGFKLHGIRRGGIVEKMGIESGDLLHTINGLKLTGPQAAMEALAYISDAETIELEMSRNGKAMGVRIVVVDG